MVIDILGALDVDVGERLVEAVARGPAPIERPDVEGEIVYVGVGMDALTEALVYIATDYALAPDGYEMVGVYGFDSAGGPGYPRTKSVEPK